LVEVAALPVVLDAPPVCEPELAAPVWEAEAEAEADAEPDDFALVMAAVDRVELDLALTDRELAEAEEADADAVEEAAADAEEGLPPLKAIGPP